MEKNISVIPCRVFKELLYEVEVTVILSSLNQVQYFYDP